MEKNIFKEKQSKILTTITLISKIFSENDFELHIKNHDYNYFQQKILELKNELPKVKEIYILYKENNNLYNFLNNEKDISKIYDLDLNQNFIKPTISKTIHSNKTNKWILAFAPIKQINNKEFIICTEIYIYNIENLYFLDVFKDIVIVSIIIVYLIIYISIIIIFKPLKELNKLMEQLNQGNLDIKIEKNLFYSEFSELFISLSNISKNVKIYIDKYNKANKNIEENNKIIENINKQNKNKNYQLNNLINILNKINLLVEKLINTKNLNDFSNSIINDVVNIFDSEKAILAQYISDKKLFKVLSSINTSIIKNNYEYNYDKENIILNLIETKNTINIYDKSVIFGEEFDNGVISPIIIDDQIEGFILLMNKKNSSEFSEENETTIKSLTKLISALWHSLHLFELASIDTNTNLYLRRYLERNLEEEILKATKNQSNISLIMIDIDNLKTINEKYRRDFGDKVIKMVIEKIKFLIKPEYIPAKYSGQIISILLPDVSFDDSLELANNIKNNIESINFAENDLKLTVSISVDSYPEKNKNPNLLLKSCEELLYLAKSKGKNRIEYN